MPNKRSSLPALTYRFRLEARPQADVWFGATRTLFNQAAAFYFGVLEAHPDVRELNDKDALTRLERLTHATPKNPHPAQPLAQALRVRLPALFRRAVIHAALGANRSFHANLERWQAHKAHAEAKAQAQKKASRFHARPPVPPRAWNKSPVFYAGMWKDFDGHQVMLQVWTGTSWAWVKFQVSGRPLPAGWIAGSPHLVEHGRGWHLHVPATRARHRLPAKVAEQLKQPTTRLCAVDLNLNDGLAVCTILRADGTVVATRFIRGGRALHSRRKRALGRVARHRQMTGQIQADTTDNAALFRYMRAINEEAAHRVSRRIVQFAQAYGATIIVFEHLGNFRPVKGKYSHRGNEKRAYWLRGRIYRDTQYKAWAEKIITCRVNPRDTSRTCAVCGAGVARYSPGEAPVDYRPGAPLVLCPNCLMRGQADRNASLNIGRRLLQRTNTQSLPWQQAGAAVTYSTTGKLRAGSHPGPEAQRTASGASRPPTGGGPTRAQRDQRRERGASRTEAGP